ncbi:MFS transporter superfamily [Sesbania bispinosa]|nr:MFS transporter superfamily [Sesbania bispinosa]
MNAIHKVYKIAKAQTLIALLSIVPGYQFTVAFIDYMGRFAIQFMTVFMFAIAIPYDYWTKKENRIGFVAMYSLTFLLHTFAVPAEILPARLRYTCHGISAVAGKAGAIVGALGFLYAAQSKDPTKTNKGYPTGIGIKLELPYYAWCDQLRWDLIHLTGSKIWPSTKQQITTGTGKKYTGIRRK